MTIYIEGYLVQEKLETTIKAIVGEGWVGCEYKLPGSRYRFDIAININGQITVIEFDGYQHYQDALLIKRDKEKNTLAAKHNIKVVRIPYWIQLTTETLKHYLGLEADIKQNFPHGFISTKHFPATFCELGIKRFLQELNTVPTSVRRDVVNSLRDRISEIGTEYVVPSTLTNILIETETVKAPALSIEDRIRRIDYIVNEINRFAIDDEEPTFSVLSEIVADALTEEMMKRMINVYKNDPNDPDILEPCYGCAAKLITDSDGLSVFNENTIWCLQNIQEVVHGKDEDETKPLPTLTSIEINKTVH